MPDSVTPEQARAAAGELLAASSGYDRTELPPGFARPLMVVVGMVARSRQFLRSAYALTEAGYPLEAMLQVRALNEYAITLRWFLRDPEHHLRVMVLEDLRGRRTIDNESADGPLRRPDTRAHHAQVEAEMIEDSGERPRGWPSLRERARLAGLDTFYSLAYRADSQTAAHPTIMALEQFGEQTSDGGLVIYGSLAPGRALTDAYLAAPVVLSAILIDAADHRGDHDLHDRVMAVCDDLGYDPRRPAEADLPPLPNAPAAADEPDDAPV